MKSSGICSRNGSALPLPRAGEGRGWGRVRKTGCPSGDISPTRRALASASTSPAGGGGEAKAEGAPPMTRHVEVMDLVARLKAAEETFVLATVVRTVSVTAAKAGAKAIIRPDGKVVAGWIGGGCARGAVLKAARDALADGEPRMVSVQPENLLAELGVKPGENRDGGGLPENICPCKGPMDVFVEPVLPHPSLVILGGSPVALSLATQARQLGYHVTLAAPATDITGAPDADMLIDGFALGPLHEAKRFVVVSTQGKGDEAALRIAAATDAAYH